MDDGARLEWPTALGGYKVSELSAIQMLSPFPLFEGSVAPGGGCLSISAVARGRGSYQVYTVVGRARGGGGCGIMAELEQERKVFLKHLEEWRQTHLGEFVLIKGTKVIGFFSSLGEAFDKGSACYGLEPFFIQRIVPEDTVNVSFLGKRLLPT